LQTALPFGFHPRVMWENVRLYLFEYSGIWLAAALAGAALYLSRTRWRKDEAIFLALVGWTVFILFLLYGQSLYGDNIRGNVTLGNSFLRYLLPLAPLVSLGIALLLERIREIPLRGAVVGPIFAVFFITLNVLTAFIRDEEGVLKTRMELLRYTEIRSKTERWVPDGGVIVSERSDKIFASGPYVVASPIPFDVLYNQQRYPEQGMYLFHRALSEEELASYASRLGEEPVPVFFVGNEALYEMPNGEMEDDEFGEEYAEEELFPETP